MTNPTPPADGYWGAVPTPPPAGDVPPGYTGVAAEPRYRPISVGDSLGGSASLVFRNLGTWIVVAIGMLIVPFLLGFVVPLFLLLSVLSLVGNDQGIVEPSGPTLTAFVTFAVVGYVVIMPVLFLLFYVWMTHLALRECSGERPGLSAIKQTRGYGRALGVGIIIVLVTLLVSAVLLLPFIAITAAVGPTTSSPDSTGGGLVAVFLIFGVVWFVCGSIVAAWGMFALTAAVDGHPPLTALRLAWKILRSNPMPVLGLYLIAMVLSFVGSMTVVGIVITEPITRTMFAHAYRTASGGDAFVPAPTTAGVSYPQS